MATRVLVDTTSTQTLTNKTLTAPTVTSGTVSLAAAPTSALDAATKGYVDGLNTTPLINGSLSASVAANALTLSLKTAGGATPSSTDPVRVTFRNSTLGDGSLVTRSVTSATTVSFASGSTLGMSNGVAARLWVGLLDNGGTVEVCAWNPYNTSSQVSLKGFLPNELVTTTAEGSGTATSAHTLYSTNARTAVPFVLLGYIEISEATAGVWATAPSTVMTYRDGMKKTGDIVQSILNVSGTMANGATAIPQDNTIPQNTEGDQYFSQAIVPFNANNLLEVESALVGCTNTDQTSTTCALFQDSTANALATVWGSSQSGADQGGITRLGPYRMRAGTTASTTFKVRAGTQSGQFTLNGTSAGVNARFGGTAYSWLKITEICA